MSFMTNCFIRKNTLELRKKLEELGYKKSEFGSDLNNSIATSVSSDKPSYICIREQSFDDTNPHTTWGFKFRIDCGTNEELFIALAALRDDSDYMQWFIFPKTQTKRISGYCGQVVGMDGYYQEIIGYEWIQYNMDDRKLSEKIESSLLLCCCDDEKKFIPHKATVEEIIEHFKQFMEE